MARSRNEQSANTRRRCTLGVERQFWETGRCCVVGVDEAGRGPLAGPVVAAAVLLPRDFAHPVLDDSKKLTPRQREEVYHFLTTDARIRHAFALATVEEIDRLNILRATHLAMERAVQALGVIPDMVLIDGLPVRGFPHPQHAIVGGDALSLSIAAASVIAKVVRDRLMVECAAQYPQYGFASHKGYGTAEHLASLRKHGPCPIHRTSFQPVAQRTFDFGEA